MASTPQNITLDQMRESLYAAVVSDALDAAGYRSQSCAAPLTNLTGGAPVLVGRAKTTLWEDLDHEDHEPYKLELEAVDACQPDDIFIAAAKGSNRSGVWGELLTTASRNGGCIGAIVDGSVRDILAMREMEFPVYARGTNVYDSLHRQRVTAIDVPVEIGGVTFSPGDLIIADGDGIVVVPQAVEKEVIQAAWEKVHAENITRDAIRDGMSATDAYNKYAIL
jgi:4-hydroxy-4-methyl-2-oxoglutarate aldolase